MAQSALIRDPESSCICSADHARYKGTTAPCTRHVLLHSASSALTTLTPGSPIMASYAARSPQLLRLSTELYHHVFSYLNDASILALRQVNHAIKNAAFGVFATRFFREISISPYTTDMRRLRWAAEHESLRGYVRVVKIQPFRPEEDADLRYRHKQAVVVWPDHSARNAYPEPLARDLLDCLSRFPNCSTYSISNVKSDGSGEFEDLPQEYPEPGDSLCVLLNGVASQRIHVRDLRIVTQGSSTASGLMLYELPREVLSSAQFRQSWAENLRVLHLCPTIDANLCRIAHLEDGAFGALTQLISAATNLESLCLANYGAVTRRLVQELAHMTPLPRLRKFVLVGGLLGEEVSEEANEKKVSGAELSTLLGRLGSGRQLRYLYLSRIFLGGGLEDWKSVLRTVQRRCVDVTNFTLDMCGRLNGGKWDFAYYCPVLETLRSRLGSDQVQDFCVLDDHHGFMGEMHTIAVEDEHGGAFEFAATPWEVPVTGPQGEEKVDWRLHETCVRYVDNRGSEPRFDVLGNRVDGMAKALAAISEGMYLDDGDPTPQSGQLCPGRDWTPLATLGSNIGSHKCGAGFRPNEDDQAWMTPRLNSAWPWLEIVGSGEGRGMCEVGYGGTWYGGV